MAQEGVSAGSTRAAFAAVRDAVRGMRWPAGQRVRSAVPGPHVSRVRGTSAEVVEYRPYRQGDDPRRIDWKLLARTDRVHVRLAEERAIFPTMVVVDASASMAFGAKWLGAGQVALGLAETARQQGDPVGLVLGPRVIAPRSRRTVVDEMMHALEGRAAGTEPLAPAVAAAVQQAARVVVVSDFLGDAEATVVEARAFVAGGGEVHAIHIIDARELEPDPKQLLLSDPEAPDVRRPMPASARAEYVRRFATWREELARDWRQARARYAIVVPGAEPLRPLIRRLIAPTGAGRLRH